MQSLIGKEVLVKAVVVSYVPECDSGPQGKPQAFVRLMIENDAEGFGHVSDYENYAKLKKEATSSGLRVDFMGRLYSSLENIVVAKVAPPGMYKDGSLYAMLAPHQVGDEEDGFPD